MKEGKKRIKNNICLNMPAIFWFEVFYRLLSILLLWEFLKNGIEIALDFSGYSYLTPGNIVTFMEKPATIILLILFFIVLFALQLIEISVLFTGFKASCSGCKLRIAELLYISFGNLKQVMKIKNISAVASVLLYGLAVNVCFLWRLAIHIRPIEYHLERFEYIKLLEAGSIAALIVLFILFSVVIYPLMYLILDRHSMKVSSKKGRRFFAKKTLKTIAVVFLISGLSWLLYFALGRLLIYIFTAAITVFVNERYHLALIFTANDYLDIISAAIASVFGVIAVTGACVSIFLKDRENNFKWESTAILYWLPEKFRSAAKIIMIVLAVSICGVYGYNAVYNGAIRAEGAWFNIQVTSHRGSSHAAPENTIPAIEKAIESVSDYVEIDVQMTKDGAVMLLHDQSLRRTTGVSRKLQDMTFEEVRKLDAGSWFSDEYAGTVIPTLEEVMETVKGRVNLNIELKRNSASADLADEVIRLIEEYDMERQCVITSTDRAYLARVKELNPEIKTGYIVSIAYGNYFDDDSVDFFSVCSSYLNESLVKQAHEYGKEIHAWTVNSIKEIDRMKRINVDNIITDNPVSVREILYQPDDIE